MFACDFIFALEWVNVAPNMCTVFYVQFMIQNEMFPVNWDAYDLCYLTHFHSLASQNNVADFVSAFWRHSSFEVPERAF